MSNSSPAKRVFPKLSIYDVASALEEDRVALNLQPIVYARNSNFIMFYEALFRLFDRQGNVRFAGEFMHLVEGSEYGPIVDQTALRFVIARLNIDQSARLSVNMSPRTMWDQGWMDILDQAAGLSSRATERLIIEFTEQSMMEDPVKTAEFMDYCSEYGVSFAIDDFGVGSTAIGHLRELRFDILKIDGTLCNDIGTNRDNQVIVRAILSIAKHFDMTTVAEFIDNEAAAKMCNELGVDGLQGFLYGKGSLFSPEVRNLNAIDEQN